MMEPAVYLIAFGAFLAILLGGFLTLRFRKCLPFFFAFSAGAIIAVSFMHLLPESIEISEEFGIPIKLIMFISVASFFLFSLIEKVFATHHIHNDEHGHEHIMGPIGAGSLILHSFLDGAAIGIAFQVDFIAGIIIAAAVLVHSVTDGINTVVLMLKNKQPLKKTIFFLLAASLAPALGILGATLLAMPENYLAYLLAFFVGEFLYIGASTLVPEMREHPSKRIILLMALGILLVVALGFAIPEAGH